MLKCSGLESSCSASTDSIPSFADNGCRKAELPHLSQLAQDGDFRELGTRYPAQSPVAWRTLATGVNPGGHGIYDTPRLSKQQLEALKSLGYLH